MSIDFAVLQKTYGTTGCRFIEEVGTACQHCSLNLGYVPETKTFFIRGLSNNSDKIATVTKVWETFMRKQTAPQDGWRLRVLNSTADGSIAQFYFPSYKYPCAFEVQTEDGSYHSVSEPNRTDVSDNESTDSDNTVLVYTDEEDDETESNPSPHTVISMPESENLREEEDDIDDEGWLMPCTLL